MRISIYLGALLIGSLVAGGCSPEPQSHADHISTESPNAASVSSQFLMFSSKEDAASYFNHTFEAQLAAQQARQPRTVVPFSDARYKRLQQITANVMAAYEAEFPEFAALPVPPVLIVNDNTINAFAPGPVSKMDQRSPYFFVYLTGALNLAPDDDALAGLTAHELAHLLFRHFAYSRGINLTKFYSVGDTQEPLGFLQVDDANARSLAMKWIYFSGRVGPYSLPELNGLSIAATTFDGRTSLYPTLLHYLKNTDASRIATDPKCSTLNADGASFSRFIGQTVSNLDNTLVLDADGKAQLNSITSMLKSDLERCFSMTKPDLYGEMAAEYGVTPTVAASYVAPVERDLFDESNDVMSGLFSVVSAIQAQMQEIEARPEFAKIRYYSYEEQADDVSVKILQRMGMDPIGQARFLESTLGDSGATNCNKIIESGAIPAYGPLSDPHHGTCFRVMHIHNLAEYLQTHPDAKLATP